MRHLTWCSVVAVAGLIAFPNVASAGVTFGSFNVDARGDAVESDDNLSIDAAVTTSSTSDLPSIDFDLFEASLELTDGPGMMEGTFTGTFTLTSDYGDISGTTTGDFQRQDTSPGGPDLALIILSGQWEMTEGTDSFEGETVFGAWGGVSEGAAGVGDIQIYVGGLVLLNPLCPADLNDDGSVGFADLQELLQAWGECPAKGDCPADLDGDGSVGFGDLTELLNAWGPCPE